MTMHSRTNPANKKRKITQVPTAIKKHKASENRAIYVSDLPRDTNEQEIKEVFQKYGIIDQGADGNKRIRMYTDEHGNFNGDCLAVYFRKESVELAIRMMDEYYFRFEDRSQGVVRVREAELSYKKHKDSAEIAARLTCGDKKVAEQNRAECNRKLAAWSESDSDPDRKSTVKKDKWAKVCILRNAFTLGELEEDDGAILEIKHEIRQKAETFGEVTNVTLYDGEEDGIVSVRFRDHESAAAFRDAVDGRHFGSARLEVGLAREKPRFRKSAKVEEPSSY